MERTLKANDSVLKLSVIGSLAIGFTLGFGLVGAARLQPDLLAFVPAQAPGSTLGAAYSYEDANVEPGQTYYYWLGSVSLAGAVTLHGPVSVIYDTPTAVTLTAMLPDDPGATALPMVLVLLALSAAMLLVGAGGARRTAAG